MEHESHLPRLHAQALAREPGPGEEEELNTEDKEWSTTTGKAAAHNLLAVARALQASPIPAPPS